MAAVSLCICDPVDMVLGITSLSSVALAVGIGVATTVLPYLFYTLAMRELPAGTATSLGIVEPLAATLFGMLLLSQVPDIFAFIGIALIVVAVFMLGKAEGGEKNAEKTAEGDDGN
jgi:inner membrane transporter RhtA